MSVSPVLPETRSCRHKANKCLPKTKTTWNSLSTHELTWQIFKNKTWTDSESTWNIMKYAKKWMVWKVIPFTFHWVPGWFSSSCSFCCGAKTNLCWRVMVQWPVECQNKLLLEEHLFHFLPYPLWNAHSKPKPLKNRLKNPKRKGSSSKPLIFRFFCC